MGRFLTHARQSEIIWKDRAASGMAHRRCFGLRGIGHSLSGRVRWSANSRGQGFAGSAPVPSRRDRRRRSARIPCVGISQRTCSSHTEMTASNVATVLMPPPPPSRRGSRNRLRHNKIRSYQPTSARATAAPRAGSAFRGRRDWLRGVSRCASSSGRAAPAPPASRRDRPSDARRCNSETASRPLWRRVCGLPRRVRSPSAE